MVGKRNYNNEIKKRQKRPKSGGEKREKADTKKVFKTQKR